MSEPPRDSVLRALSQAAAAGDRPPRAARHLGQGQQALTVCMALALLAWFGTNLWQRWEDRTQLQAAHQSQEALVNNAAKLRASLDALAADTRRLAEAGNPQAQSLVAALQQRGITIAAPAVSPPSR
jgi:plasmid maintenance system antidote protein VapI